MAAPPPCSNCGGTTIDGARHCHHCGQAVSEAAPPPRVDYDLEKFFSLALDMLCIAGTDGYFKRINPAFERVLGYSAEELLGKPFVDFIHPDDRTETVREVGKLRGGSPTLAFENRYRCKDGSYKHLFWTSFPEPGTGLLYAVARDVTELRQLQDELWKPVRVDLLTGVANRQAFYQRLDEEWSRACRLQVPLAMVLVDLDRFDGFNRVHGRDGGDECLKAVADVLKAHARRTGDVVARLSGKRFAVLLMGGLTKGDAESSAERIRAEVEGLAIRTTEHGPPGAITVSVGVASLVPPVDGAAGQLMAAAEDAVVEAKEHGRNRVGGARVGPGDPS